MPRIIKPVAKDSFTAATISVDGQGKNTAASRTAGAQGYQLTEFRQGSDSFTYSAVDTNATKGAGLIGGGGGGGAVLTQGAGARPGGHGFLWCMGSGPFSRNYADQSVQVGSWWIWWRRRSSWSSRRSF